MTQNGPNMIPNNTNATSRCVQYNYDEHDINDIIKYDIIDILVGMDGIDHIYAPLFIE